ncbi:Restriction endonuclease [Candidatus Desulfarcum epimagneticum]|uniref:Restriction endonuclease n=1 Tax=uncultured Desulfobacteraceae bacterium TaxID=218296 RepID=A0A484HGG1_9BACT|nr:Restriction endonuclease [uncultured Desulfobacteraceae bacterium]
MKIEVACKKDDTAKTKGDLLENLSKKLLQAQGYDVIKEIKFTGVELDLLCKHRVNEKQIYVECKAQKEKIRAPVLRQLLGTVTGYEYAEGWIVSTSEFGKEAKGFVEMWKKKPQEQSSKLSFYGPEDVIESLQNASVICPIPLEKAENYIGGKEFLGDWTMMVTSYGRFWGVYTLNGGAPNGVLIYNAENGRHIQDEATLNNISQLETNLAGYDLKIGVCKTEKKFPSLSISSYGVVEVQIGDSWNDYRPARPQDFVGREDAQKEIIAFLNNAKEKQSDTRIFAITGKSGLGKSSLIAKVRDRSRNKFYKNKHFTFAVDMRGAVKPSYIATSLLKSLKTAQKVGFGEPLDIQLTDPSTPLSSPTITKYLQSVERKGQVICLIFDQFEELYSKPELFNVFSAAKDLMLDVASYKGNFVLGFAWKTDSTTQQDHPAYHMWHKLSDYRRIFKLDVFDSGEISKCITTFEKEIQKKIPIEIRHQISASSQGFPWLLKKLCINLYENIKKGEGTDSISIDLDVNRLFENDLDVLSSAEHTCLKIIAQKAPADWSEIIEISGIAVLNNLVHKRLVIKSGDRLNIYWDIFKDYLLTGKVPIVPFNYIPTSDISSMLKVFQELNTVSYLKSDKIANLTQLNERTVWNIGADLVMFGLAERKGTQFKAHRELNDCSNASALKKLREKIGKHSLKLAIYKAAAGKTVDPDFVTEILKGCLPKARFGKKTWTTYKNRLSNLFVHTGYFLKSGENIIIQDSGSAITDIKNILKRGQKRGVVFSAAASPATVCETLDLIKNKVDEIFLVKNGYRNALTVLRRFDLVSKDDEGLILNILSIDKFGGHVESIWTSAKNEPVIVKCIEKLNHEPNISGFDLGHYISIVYEVNWTVATQKRNGNSLRQWSVWVKEGTTMSSIPTPPGRTIKQKP